MLVFSCSQKPAKIVNRSNVLYNKNNQFNRDKYQNLSKKSSPNKPDKAIEKSSDKNLEIAKNQQVVTISKKSSNSEENFVKANNSSSLSLPENKELKITISQDNETLYAISKKYQISAREIIDLNKLKAPYRLKKGDIIKIPHQQFHVVKKGETLFGIARNYHMKVDEIIAINKLQKPYAVKTGNRLQITNFKNIEEPKNLTYKTHEQKIINPISSVNNSLANTSDKNSPPVKKLQANIMASNNLDKTNALNNAEFSKDNVEISNKSDKSLTNKSLPKETQTAEKKELVSENQNINSSQQLTKSNESSSESTTIAQNKIISSQEENNIEEKKNFFSWPVRGSVVSRFGPKKGGLYNDGINIKAKEGASVGSAEDGIVAYAGNELKGYGNLVIIKHSQGWITAYAHLKEINVSKGQKILKAQKIGSVGNTGSANFPQLYFGLRKGREAVNPQSYLKGLN
jgi:murein DD-endopeptidase MepM/ murein hydrolase activator NlpD